MRIYRIVVWLGFLVLLCTSCEYEPEGDFVNNRLRPLNPPNIQIIDLSLPQSDTIVVYNDLPVTFMFEIPVDYSLYGILLLLDGLEYGTTNNSYGEFNLSRNSLATGIHELKLDIYTSAGTHSLADALGMVGYRSYATWILKVRERPSGTIKTYLKDGSMHLSWDRYKGANLLSYSVSRSDSMTYIMHLDNTTDTEMVDMSYCGEGTSYIVEINTSDAGILPYATLKVKQELPTIYLTADTLNNYTILWDKPKYYSCFTSYILFRDHGSGVYDQLTINQDVSDTSFVIADAHFGDKLNLKLRIVPRGENRLYYDEVLYNFETKKEIYAGWPFHCNGMINELYQVSNHEVVFRNFADTIFKYSISSRKIVGIRGYVNGSHLSCLEASPTGSHLTNLVGTEGWFSYCQSTNIYDASYLNHNSFFLSSKTECIPVSDAGTMLFSNGSDKIGIYDYRIQSIIAVLNKSSSFMVKKDNTKFSSGGDYILVNYDSLRLIQFKNNTFQNIAVSPQNTESGLIEFDGTNQDQFIIWDGSIFSVRKCSDYSVVSEFPLNSKPINIDFRNGEILTYTSGHLLVLSYPDGSFLHDIPVNFDCQDPNSCFLADHTLIFTNRLYDKALLYFIK